MFSPNLDCLIQLTSGKTDIYSQPIPGKLVKERCSIIKLMIENEKSSVRADSSASRGSALELETMSTILLTAATRGRIDDIVKLNGYSLRIRGMFPRFDLQGKLDHYQVDVSMWSAK